MEYNRLKDLEGFTIQATDGEIGKVADFYFDDDAWTIRYMVVETGDWLHGRKVLIAPESLGEPELGSRLFPVDLTLVQIEDSPRIDAEKPVSRQDEIQLRQYYGWIPYWGMLPPTTISAGVAPFPQAVEPVPVTGDEPTRPLNPLGAAKAADTPPEDFRRDIHLRSFNAVRGYHLNANDGRVGHVSDLIVEDEKWSIMYMIVDTGGLFGGRQVLVSPSWVQQVSWQDKEVDVNLKAETIKTSPIYDPAVPLDSSFEEGLRRHYGQHSEH